MRNCLFLFAALQFVSAAIAQQRPQSEIRRLNTLAEMTGGDSIVQFMPSTIGPYCPKKLLGGDREFGGHGPEIYAWIKINILNKRSIETEVFMHARETVSDWSETQGTWKKILYTAPAGYEITGIVSGKYSEVKYISRPGVNAFSPAGLVQALGDARGTNVPFKDDGLVTRWNITGDTGGDDISTDDDPHDDTQVAIQLNPVSVKLKKIQRANRVVRPSGNANNSGVVATPPANEQNGDIVVTPPASSSSVTTIKLEDITEFLCPSRLIRGDREFDGHGPRIKTGVKLRISPNKTALLADINFFAEETTPDHSYTKGNWTKAVYKAPYGTTIKEIVSDKSSYTQFISPPGGFQFIVPGADVAKALYTFLDYTDIKSGVLKAFGYGPEEKSALSALVKGTIDNGNTVVQVPPVEGTLVKFFHIVGDTGGPDISDDDNCNDDTRIVGIEFFPAKIKLVSNKPQKTDSSGRK
ncbi:MAG TPA: hypothetical protein VJU78_21070 [Chitinophagaceae bacterium]|nr:hypothetical protein [Chitinophagaceae bacterium]